MTYNAHSTKKVFAAQKFGLGRKLEPFILCYPLSRVKYNI